MRIVRAKDLKPGDVIRLWGGLWTVTNPSEGFSPNRWQVLCENEQGDIFFFSCAAELPVEIA